MSFIALNWKTQLWDTEPCNEFFTDIYQKRGRWASPNRKKPWNGENGDSSAVGLVKVMHFNMEKEEEGEEGQMPKQESAV